MSDEHGEHHHHHHHHGEDGHPRQREWSDLLTWEIWRLTIANMRESGLPWWKTPFAAAANYWLKIRRWQVCCGNIGHAGC